ncbi:hypothetical protein M0R45_028181 [Rubus argutus]|uniref:ChrR-like cupin domain-containing protein n=1 Tax=Rubus argutus TaxID=59490 RepID=A0AAW1W6E8_RUBAR
MAESTATRPLQIIAGADSFGYLGTSSYSHHRRRRRPPRSLFFLLHRRYRNTRTRGLRHRSRRRDLRQQIPGTSSPPRVSPPPMPSTRPIQSTTPTSSPCPACQLHRNRRSRSSTRGSRLPFKAPCPASESKPWPEEIESFLDNSIKEMPKIGGAASASEVSSCSICCLVKNRELNPIDIIPGGSMKIVRESPTSAIVRFKAGSVEPAHHHTFGHDLVVMEGKKSVWNLTKKEKFDLVVGDYLFTPAGDVHRVKYYEDTEFFIKWDGKWDMFFDEDLEAANKAIQQELENGSK